MTNIRIIKAKNYDDLSGKAAAVIAAQVILKPQSVLGLATGSTPLGLYERLAKGYREGALDFSGVTSFNLDEYHGIERNHEQSYYYYMHKNLFSKININPKNAHLPDGMAADTGTECKRYDDAIAVLGGIDLQLLGIGHNGHIGFNEPDTKFTKAAWCITLAERTIEANARFFASAADVPRRALTMGMGSIMQAKKILLVVSGEEKRDILAKSLNGDITPEVPASILQLHPDVVLVTDCDI